MVTILASIRKHTGITWTFVAGPYRVQVVGTRLTIDWDCDRRQLRVAVREGRVKVREGICRTRGSCSMLGNDTGARRRNRPSKPFSTG